MYILSIQLFIPQWLMLYKTLTENNHFLYSHLLIEGIFSFQYTLIYVIYTHPEECQTYIVLM